MDIGMYHTSDYTNGEWMGHRVENLAYVCNRKSDISLPSESGRISSITDEVSGPYVIYSCIRQAMIATWTSRELLTTQCAGRVAVLVFGCG